MSYQVLRYGRVLNRLLEKEGMSKKMKETEKLESSSTVEVILEEFSRESKVSVLKTVLDITGLGLKEGKDLIEAAPSLIIKVDLKKAEQIKKLLNEAGAKVTLKK